MLFPLTDFGAHLQPKQLHPEASVCIKGKILTLHVILHPYLQNYDSRLDLISIQNTKQNTRLKWGNIVLNVGVFYVTFA